MPGYTRLVQAQEPKKQGAALEEFKKALRTVSEKVKGPYFLGEEFSLVDVAIAPWVVRDYVVRGGRGYKREDVSEGWVKWAGELEKREIAVETMNRKEYLVEIYGRYLRDEAQSGAAKAIRADRAIP